MTFLQQITLHCPVCETRFDSLVAKVAKPRGGFRSDFREEASGRHALPYLIHMCMLCGYAGLADQFENIELTQDVRDRVWTELAPTLSAAAASLGLTSSEKYEAAAKVAEWQYADARRIAELWLKAAWCCEDENDTEAERYFRRKAAWAYGDALDDFDGFAPDERASITYLIGELWRRIGDDTLATYWFDRVPDEVVDFKAQEYILAAARRQAEEPGEWLS